MRYEKILCYLLTMLMLSISVIGQLKTVTEKEIDELLENARMSRSGTSYRETTSTLVYGNKDPNPEITSYSVADWQSGGDWHIIAENKYNGRKIKTETIKLGGYKYTRVDGGEWIKKDLQAPQTPSSGGIGSGSGSGVSSTPPTVTLECIYVGTEKVGDIDAEVYQKLKTITFTSQKGKIIRTVIKKYWFDKQMRLIKSVEDDKFQDNSGFHRGMHEYDYKTPIKIEAPIK